MLKLVLTLITFSILLLMPVAAQNAFAELVGHDGKNNKHILIDIATGEATDLGPTTFNSRASGLAATRGPVDTATSPTDATVITHPVGTLFGVYRDGTDDKHYVIQVDTATGKANKIVEVVGGISTRGVAFGVDGTTFYSTDALAKTLYTINMKTGVKTIVGALGNIGFDRSTSLQFDTGSIPARFLSLVKDSPADSIISIDPATGIGSVVTTLMDSTGAPVSIDACALVKNPDDGRWFTVARNSPIHLFEVDVTSGLVTDIGFLNQKAVVASDNICGLAFSEGPFPPPAPIVSGSKISYQDPHLGDPKHGQGHDNGFCMNQNCINVNGLFNHFSETTVPQGSTQTFTVLVNCPRGANTCNHISLAGALPDADFYDDRWSVTVDRQVNSDNWDLTVYNPFREIGDATVTVQSVGQSFVTASFNIQFLIPGSVGTPEGIGDPQENNRHIHVTVWDSHRGASNYIFNEGIYVDDIYAYPEVETSFDESLEYDQICVNENINKRYSCAFDKVREWTIKNAEKALSELG